MTAYPVAVEIVADIADALWHINRGLDERHGDRLPLFDIAGRAALRRTIRDDLTAEARDRGFPMKPQRLLSDIRAVLGPADILLSDVGAHKMWVARYYQCHEPNTCLISNGFCSMGFALPGAMGAKLALPERRVLAVCGDGGFLMNVQELETAKRLGVNIVVGRLDRRRLRADQVEAAERLRRPALGPRLRNPDFEALAGAFGIWGRTIAAADEFTPALKEAFDQPGRPWSRSRSTTPRTASSPSGWATWSARSERRAAGRGGLAPAGQSDHVRVRARIGAAPRAGKTLEGPFMAKGYWVSCYRAIKDADALGEYAKLAGPAITAGGGTFLARGGGSRPSRQA